MANQKVCTKCLKNWWYAIPVGIAVGAAAFTLEVTNSGSGATVAGIGGLLTGYAFTNWWHNSNH